MILAACNSINIVEELVKSFYQNQDAEVPFFCFMGSDGNVSVDTLIESLPIFYNTLNEYGNINKAIEAMNIEDRIIFRYDNCYRVFMQIVSVFANKWIKERVTLISEDPDLLMKLYCPMYYYTYGEQCENSTIFQIMTDKQFYIDYLNKRLDDYLMVSRCPQTEGRFQRITNIENFEKSIPEIKIIRR